VEEPKRPPPEVTPIKNSKLHRMFYLSMGWKEQEAILPSVEEHSYTALTSLKSLEQLIYRIS
jgi:hypothetical protein